MSGKIKPTSIFRLKMATLAALDFNYAEDDMILVVNKHKQRRGYSPNVDIKRYERANTVINALKDGITSKRQLANLCGKDFTEIHKIFKLLWENGIIEDYHLDYHNVIPKQLTPFDTALLRHGLEWRRAEDIKVGDYVAQPIQKTSKAPIILDMTELLSEYYPVTNKYVYVSGNVKRGSCMPLIYEWLEENGVPVFDYGGRTKFLEEHNWTIKGYDVAYRSIQSNQTPIRIARFLEITPEIAFAMGLYLAEGSKNSPGCQRRIKFDRNAGWKLTHFAGGLKRRILLTPVRVSPVYPWWRYQPVAQSLSQLLTYPLICKFRREY